MTDAHPALDPQRLLTEAGRLRAIARSLAGEGAAEDLVQDTWVAALEAEVRGSERDAEGWRAWLGGVTRNLARRRALREGRRPDVEERAARPEAQGGVADLAERLELQRRLADALLALEEPYRGALALRYLDGLDHAAIAERQGVTNANARRRVSRGLAMLRARMGVEEPQGRGKPLAGLFAWTGLFQRGESAVAPTIGAPLGAGGAVVGSKVVLGAAAVVASAAVVVTISVREPAGRSVEELEVAAAASPAQPEGAGEEGGRPLAPAETRGLRDQREPGAAVLDQPAAPFAGAWGAVSTTSGEAIEGVSVRWCDAGGVLIEASPEAETDGGGRYRLARPAGGVQLAFERAGYLVEVLEASRDGQIDVALVACPRLVGVLRGESGEPARPPGRVRVSVLPGGAEEPVEVKAELADDGSFRFDDLPVGRLVKVWARAKGFEALDEPRDVLLEAETTRRLDLELPRGLVVVGVVRDEETREPVPFAEIWSEGWDYEPDSDEPTTVADAEGRFRIEGITRDLKSFDGREFFAVNLKARGEEHVASPLLAFGVQPDEEGLCEVELLLVRRSCSLRAVIYEPGREEVAQGVYVWSIDSENNLDHQRSNRRGEIELEGLPAGSFALEAYRLEREKSGSHESLLLRLELEPGSHDRLELELRRDPTTALEGRLTDANGAPRAGVRVTAHHDFHSGGLTIALDSEGCTTDAEGRYRFEGMRAGEYRLRPEGCSLPDEQVLNLAWGEERRDLDFRVGECMTVRGRVELAGAAADGLSVDLLLPADADPGAGRVHPVGWARVEADGSFAVGPVLEGDYVLWLKDEQRILERVPVGPGSSSGVVLRAR